MLDRKFVEWFCKLVKALRLSMAVWLTDDKNVKSVILFPKSLDVPCSQSVFTSLQFSSACVITLLYGNSSEYWHISVEFLFISSSNNVIRSGVVEKLMMLHALLVAAIGDEICGCKLFAVNCERFWQIDTNLSSGWSCVCWTVNVSAAHGNEDDVDDDDVDVVEDDDDADEDELASVGSKSVVESISGSTAWKKPFFLRILFFYEKNRNWKRKFFFKKIFLKKIGIGKGFRRIKKKKQK